jgi:hypothetical protein
MDQDQGTEKTDKKGNDMSGADEDKTKCVIKVIDSRRPVVVKQLTYKFDNIEKMTCEDLKLKIAQDLNRASTYFVMYQSRRLEPSDKLTVGIPILLIIKSDFQFQIFIRMLDDKSKLMEVSPTDTILDIKKRIEEFSRIPVEKQRLTYESRGLQNENTLESYGIDDLATLVLLISINGS